MTTAETVLYCSLDAASLAIVEICGIVAVRQSWISKLKTFKSTLHLLKQYFGKNDLNTIGSICGLLITTQKIISVKMSSNSYNEEIVQDV